MTVSPSAFDGPLSPYRVIDLTDARGLLAGHLLALLGADVIQVEPLQGSCARRTGPFDLRGGESLFWAAFASGKRGVALAYDQRDGLSQLLELIRGADILIESHDPGRMDAMGLGRATLKEINPRLVQVSITGFGSTGPKAHYATSDLILWAAAGTMWPHRGQDGVPLRMSVPQAFHQAAIDAAGGALIALLARGDNGEGQHVDVSAQRSCMLCTLSSHLATAVNHVNFNPLGGVQSDKLLALSGSSARTRKTKWKLRDGLAEMHIGMGAAAGRYSNALFAWLDSLNGPRVEYAEWDWTKVPERLLNGDLVAGDIIDARAYAEKHLANFTKAEILVISQERGLLMAPVMTTKDLVESPQLAARHYFTPFGEGDQMQRLPNPFSSGGASEAVPLRAAPRLGEHDSEVLETVSRPAMAARAADAPAQALAGLKIVDLAWAVAGPLIGRTLADFGAIVIRVESRTRVDSARNMGPFPDAVFDAQKSLLFENCNANKLGLTVNLQTEAGRKLLRDLVRSADVLIESFAPGQMERFGMGYPSLQAINPGLVMLSSSLLGQTGPNAAFAGFGNVGGALSGFQQIVGLRDKLPIGTYGPYTDFVGPRFGLIALLSALDRRRRTKEGCHLDMSQVEATISLLSPQLLDMACNGRIAQANGNRDAAMAPCGVFPAGGDDRWVAIACKIDSEWRALARAIGGEALADDPRFLNLALRQENEDALEGVLAAWTSSRDAATIEELLQQAGVPAHVVAASPEILGDTHLAATGAFVRLAHPLMGETIFDAARYDLDGTPAQYRRTAPYPGRDNQEVLEELLGYSKSEISMLDAAGALT